MGKLLRTIKSELTLRVNLPVIVFTLLIIKPGNIFGQPDEQVPVRSDTVPDCYQKDIGDILRRGAESKKPPKERMLLALPNFSYNPVNGFMIGVTGSAGFYLGDKESTNSSAINFNAVYTTKKQLIFNLKSNLYTPNDRLFLQGDWRFLIYNSYTWGLGTDSPDSLESDNTLVWMGAQTGNIEVGFPMDYNYAKFHQVMNYRVLNNHYIGIGYHLDHFFRIRDNALQMTNLPYELTPHYIHSEINGFDSSKYTLSGFSLSYVFDSRDNPVNAYSGFFVNINYRINPEFLGSSSNSSALWMEFRTYAPLSATVRRHLIGFWLLGNFQVTGHQPYMTLMATGEDQKARSGRGYITGRYRGENFLYGEVEYRFPISRCSKVLGGVIFLNATTASDNIRDVMLFDYIRPGGGAGLRIMINKQFRTNITIDFGLGHKSQGLYFSGSEAF